ncbi:MAG: hypothetical protein B6I19_05730 [Bacteroidetes bacterium 4572_114]|nr:MAG: hypothetical protein B6I19_05730 [Bacteroidetes bacterium 4572_114]
MKKLLLFTATIIIGLQSYSQWYSQSVNTNSSLKDVFFLNEDIGWVYGNYADSTTAYGVIYKTTNGGSKWDSISSPPYGSGKFYFIDSLTGWGHLIWSEGSQLFKTEDGGINWQLFSLGTIDFDFINENEGFLLENFYGNMSEPSCLYKTENGGTNWQFVDSIGGYTPGSGTITPSLIEFINSDVGFVSYFWQGGGGFSGHSIMKTNDGGLSWMGASSPNEGIKILHFITEDIGYSSCLGYNMTGLYKTTDGAESWENIYDEYVGSMFFLSPEEGWIGRPYGDESVLYTNNGGSTWDTQYSDNSIFDIFFTDSLNGWAVGPNGLILHTNNGGGTVTHLNENKPNLESLKIYPNPVSESVTFEFILEEQGTVIIDVYNTLGVKVAPPTYQALSQGLHQLEWNASYLNDGIYFCKFNIGKSSTTKRFIKKQQ